MVEYAKELKVDQTFGLLDPHDFFTRQLRSDKEGKTYEDMAKSLSRRLTELDKEIYMIPYWIS